MLKKINIIAVEIKFILNNHIKPIKIARLLNISKQRVNYWIKTEIKYTQFRRKKISDKYIDESCNLAGDKTTSEMSTRKITSIINTKLKNDNLLYKNNSQLCVGKVLYINI